MIRVCRGPRLTVVQKEFSHQGTCSEALKLLHRLSCPCPQSNLAFKVFNHCYGTPGLNKGNRKIKPLSASSPKTLGHFPLWPLSRSGLKIHFCWTCGEIRPWEKPSRRPPFKSVSFSEYLMVIIEADMLGERLKQRSRSP